MREVYERHMGAYGMLIISQGAKQMSIYLKEHVALCETVFSYNNAIMGCYLFHMATPDCNRAITWQFTFFRKSFPL